MEYDPLKKFFFLILIAITTNSFSQNLKQIALKKSDKQSGIINKYEFRCSDSYCVLSLDLYRNGDFFYKESKFNSDVYSRGKWHKNGNFLVLKSVITDDNLPIELSYTNDSSAMINGFKIGIVRNLKNDYLKDAIIYINSDSIECSPLVGICSEKAASIDSIKIKFENGLSSKWMKVKGKSYRMIIPIVQINFTTSNFVVFNNKQFRINKTSISMTN